MIDESIIDCAANPEIIAALESDLADLLSGPHDPQESLKLQTLINRAKDKWQKVQDAEDRARNRAENEATVSAAAKDSLTAILGAPDSEKTLEEAERLFEAAKAAKEAWETAADADKPAKKADFETAAQAVTTKLGIDMDKFKKPGTGYLLVGHFEAAQRVLNEAQKTATMGS